MMRGKGDTGMPGCPRCGATNAPGRTLCWNCWTALPVDATPEPSPAPPVAVESLPPAIDIPVLIPEGLTPLRDLPPAADVPIVIPVFDEDEVLPVETPAPGIEFPQVEEEIPLDEEEAPVDLPVVEEEPAPIALEIIEEDVVEAMPAPDEIVEAPVSATPECIEDPLPAVEQEAATATAPEEVAAEEPVLGEPEVFEETPEIVDAEPTVIEEPPIELDAPVADAVEVLEDAVPECEEVATPDSPAAEEDTAPEVVLPSDEIVPEPAVEAEEEASAADAEAMADEASLPARPPLRRGALVLTGLVLALALLGGAAWYLWNHGLRPQAPVSGATEVANQYLAALAIHDMGAQQQLASMDSKDLHLPAWFTITAGRALYAVTEKGSEAATPVQVTLAPTPDKGTPPQPARSAALTRSYSVTLPLVKEPIGWRVNQRQFYANLKSQLAKENAAVQFPGWDTGAGQ